MLVLLHELEFAVDLHGTDGYDDAYIAGLCLQLITAIPREFRQYPDQEIAKADFLRYHRALVGLCNRVYRSFSEIVRTAIRDLLVRHEKLYHDLIDPQQPLPCAYMEGLKAEIYADLPQLAAQLAQKCVPQEYVTELRHAADSLFTAAKRPVLTYHYRTYLPDFFGMLGQLANDARDKKWPERFVESLVNYNFNYMGFFNRWRERREAEFQAARNAGNVQALLSGWHDVLQHYTPVPGLAFIPGQASLLEHMTVFLCAKAASLLDWKDGQSVAAAPVLKTTHNSKIQSLDFRYRYKQGLYPYRNMEEAAKDYSATHLSKTGRHISPHTLQRSDTLEMEDAVHIYLQQLTKMIEEIRSDFKL